MNTIYFKAIGKRRKNLHDFIHVFKGHGRVELNFNEPIESINHPTHDMIEVNVMESSLKIIKKGTVTLLQIHRYPFRIDRIHRHYQSEWNGNLHGPTLVAALHFPRGGAIVEGCARW